MVLGGRFLGCFWTGLMFFLLILPLGKYNNKKYEIKVLLSSKSYEIQLKNTKEFIQKTLAQITEDKAKIKTENNAAKLETK